MYLTLSAPHAWFTSGERAATLLQLGHCSGALNAHIALLSPPGGLSESRDCLLLTKWICMLSHPSTCSYLSKKMHIFSCFISAQRQMLLESLPFSKVLCFLIMLSPHLTCPIQMISTLPFSNIHISEQSFIVGSCQLIPGNKHLESQAYSVYLLQRIVLHLT